MTQRPPLETGEWEVTTGVHEIEQAPESGAVVIVEENREDIKALTVEDFAAWAAELEMAEQEAIDATPVDLPPVEPVEEPKGFSQYNFFDDAIDTEGVAA